MVETAQLEQRLIHAIQPRVSLLTAYSGGVDSTLVAVAARRALGRANAPAAIGDTASLPRRELDDARHLARAQDIELIEIHPAEQTDARYQANATDRCYFCKTHLYRALHALAAERGISYIANGTNADDPADHRPGLIAADEARVVSPLLEAGLTKADVRTLAHHWHLPNADKPAAACLASRIPYGTRVTTERLSRVEQAEDVLHELGFVGFRVRHHEHVARLEIPPQQWPRLLDEATREQVLRRLRTLGYTYIALDIAGFRSGSANEATHQ